MWLKHGSREGTLFLWRVWDLSYPFWLSARTGIYFAESAQSFNFRDADADDYCSLENRIQVTHSVSMTYIADFPQNAEKK
jgi:hypothetical protein